VYMRYLGFMKLEQRIAHERLTRICFIDYDREMVQVAERPGAPSGESEILGVGRLSKSHGRNEAEFAVLIRDDFQKLGLGSEFLRRLLNVARDEKLDRVFAIMSAENTAMRKMALSAGFRLDGPSGGPSEDHLTTAVIELTARARSDAPSSVR
jgi:acetyltransferase